MPSATKAERKYFVSYTYGNIRLLDMEKLTWCNSRNYTEIHSVRTQTDEMLRRKY